jgi:alpha-1,6-mannosyltransferase
MNLRPNGMSGALTPRSQAIENPTDKQWLTILVGIGVLLLVAEVFTFRAHRDNLFYWVLFWLLISGIPFVFAVWWTFQRKKFPANTLLIILFGGLLFRSILVPLDPPRLSTDIYRYIWDGRVQAAGINPYLYLPVDARLAELRDGSILSKY